MRGSPGSFQDLLDKLKAEYERVQDENQCFRKRLKELGEDSPCAQDVLYLGSPENHQPMFVPRKISGRRPSYALSLQEPKWDRRPSRETLFTGDRRPSRDVPFDQRHISQDSQDPEKKQVRLRCSEQSASTMQSVVTIPAAQCGQDGSTSHAVSVAHVDSNRSGVMRSWKSNGGKKPELADAWAGTRKLASISPIKKKAWEGIDIFSPTNPSLRNTSIGVVQHLVLLPSSVFNMVWKAVQVLLLTIDVFLIPLEACLACKESNTVFLLYVAVAFWTLDMVVSACTAYVDREGKLERRLRRVIFRYCKHRFWPDLIFLSIEWAFFIKVNVSRGNVETGFLKVLCWARLLKVMKMHTLTRTFTEHIRSNITLTVFSLSKIMALTLFCTHMVACGWQAVMNPENLYDDPYERYALALHFAFAQYGLGAADYEPSTLGERLYSNFVAIMFVILCPIFLSSSMNRIGAFHDLVKAREQHEQQLREYLCRHQVTWTLRNRIWIFFRKEHKNDREHLKENNVELVQRLPTSLIFQLRVEVFIPILNVHPFFDTYTVSRQGIRPYGLYHLVETKAVTEFSLKANDELFAEGDKALAMHFLVQGTLLYSCALTQTASFQNSGDTGGQRGGWWFADSGDGGDVCKVASDGADVTQMKPGDWLGEPVLWIRWHHMGFANAKTHCELVVLEAEKFQTSMRLHVPEAVEYARLYLQYFKDREHKMNDLYQEKEVLRTIAQGIFHPKIRFNIIECWPGAVSKWHPSTRRDFQQSWSTVWKAVHTTHPSAMIYTMHTDMKHDAILVYQTLFAQNCADRQPCDFLTEKEIAEHDTRVLFLKRLLLCFAISRTTLSTENNGAIVQPWPFPLAAAMCHGGRILAHLIGVSWEELVSFLLNGDVDWDWFNGIPEPLYVRLAASHMVRMDRSGSLQEVKVKGVSAITQHKRNFGMDLPVGGLGNPAPGYRSGQLCIGPAGVPFRRSRKGAAYAKEIQHGHLYLRVDDFSLTSTLMGGKDHDGTRRLTWGSRGRGQSSSNVTNLTSSGVGRQTSTDSASSGHTYNTTQEEWSRLQQSATMTLETLEETLRVSNKHELASSKEHLALLHEQLNRELILEKNVSTNELRCRGMLVHMLIVIEGNESEGERFLAHESAIGTTDSSLVAEHNKVEQRTSQITALRSQVTHQISRAPTIRGPTMYARKELDTLEVSPMKTIKSQSGTMSESEGFTTNREYEDRVLTVLCMNDEKWTVAVARYCQQVLQLSDSTVEKILTGCHNEASSETFSFTCEPSPTICHHHIKVCGEELDLEYTAVRLKTRLKERDWIGTSSGSFMTFEKVPQLWGFSSVWNSEAEDESEQEHKGPGFVQRTWRWVSMAQGKDMEDVPGLHRPEEYCSLHLKRMRQSSLLIGIESSSPHKTDLFGNAHTIDAKSKDISAFGKRKWRDYDTEGQCIPAPLGGVRCTVTEERFQQLKDVCSWLSLSKPSDGYSKGQENEKELFKQILSGSDETMEKGLQDAIDNAVSKQGTSRHGIDKGVKLDDKSDSSDDQAAALTVQSLDTEGVESSVVGDLPFMSDRVTPIGKPQPQMFPQHFEQKGQPPQLQPQTFPQHFEQKGQPPQLQSQPLQQPQVFPQHFEQKGQPPQLQSQPLQQPLPSAWLHL